MQKEELSDSRNRQEAENDRRQNEGQIWQRALSSRFFARSATGHRLRVCRPNPRFNNTTDLRTQLENNFGSIRTAS
jgi:hypothetical protein